MIIILGCNLPYATVMKIAYSFSMKFSYEQVIVHGFIFTFIQSND